MTEKKKIPIDTETEEEAIEKEGKGEEAEGKAQAEEIGLEECKRLLQQKDVELKASEERVLRLGAEFENFKKRLKREKEEYMKYALETFSKELLPFLDNLERAIQSARENPDIEKIIEGLELTLNGYLNTLEKFGLKGFSAEGRRFDPNFHEAFGVEEHDGVEENTVVKELLKGYTLHGRVVRPALVVVSKKTQKESGQSNPSA